ncbi:hypothetical protein [Campylobacter concisus]|uniref:hypothetical protein n=1 Tax=Campylobacter concisus TaxID=199 RepID=UPI001CA5A4FB|nr:hypothetical protein [Campylobacter concisus]
MRACEAKHLKSSQELCLDASLLNLKIKITAKYRRPKRHGLALLVFKFAFIEEQKFYSI